MNFTKLVKTYVNPLTVIHPNMDVNKSLILHLFYKYLTYNDFIFYYLLVKYEFYKITETLKG